MGLTTQSKLIDDFRGGYMLNTKRSQLAERAIYGPSIQIDPLFPYYQDRSACSIAEEIELAGYQCVHYFVVNENVVHRELIDAFHARGIPVWAMVIGNGTFSTEHFPSEWPSWQMELLKETHDGFWRFSHHCDGYRLWKKAAMSRLVTDYPFDGIEIAEPYFPEWGGIERGVYGDVGSWAQRAFQEQYELEIPEFRDTASPTYYTQDTERYAKWIQFRVDAVNEFIHDMINGTGGVREARPDILAATWSLAVDAGDDAPSRLREEQGLDASSMIGRVRPDIHFFQTHWPDWVRGDLPPDYIAGYEKFAEPVRTQFPGLPLGVQADIGSSRTMIKGSSWLERFKVEVARRGYATWTAYEYHIGGFMYDSLPEPLQAVRSSEHTIAVSFSKRIDEASAVTEGLYRIWLSDREWNASWTRIQVDGHRLILTAKELPHEEFEIEVSGVRDTPACWLFKDMAANQLTDPKKLWIAESQPTEGVG